MGSAAARVARLVSKRINRHFICCYRYVFSHTKCCLWLIEPTHTRIAAVPAYPSWIKQWHIMCLYPTPRYRCTYISPSVGQLSSIYNFTSSNLLFKSLTLFLRLLISFSLDIYRFIHISFAFACHSHSLSLHCTLLSNCQTVRLFVCPPLSLTCLLCL